MSLTASQRLTMVRARIGQLHEREAVVNRMIGLAIASGDNPGRLESERRDIREELESLHQAVPILEATPMITKHAPPTGSLVDLSARDLRRYSFASAILSADKTGMPAGTFEMEVSEEIRKNLPPDYRSRGGFFMPIAGVPIVPSGAPSAALTTGAVHGGKELVYEEPGSFVEMLRNQAMCVRLGARFLPNLRGNVAFPKQTGAADFHWMPENPNEPVPDSEPTTGQILLKPRTGMSSTVFTRQLLAQSTIDAEQFVREDLVTVGALAIDRAALHGTGTNNEPLGLYHASGVSSVAFDGPLTWSKVVAMESAVAAENALLQNLAYLTTPEIRGAGKQTAKDPGSGQYLWTGGHPIGEMNGYAAAATNQVAKNLGDDEDEHGMIFGAWNQLLIGMWGAIEVLVDPYTLAKRGEIAVTMFLLADVAIRHPEAFAKATGLRPAAKIDESPVLDG